MVGRRVIVVLLLLGALLGAWRWQVERQRDRGAAIYRGEAGVPGTLAGQATALPAVATRCSNCHGAPQRSESLVASGAAQPPSATPVAPAFAPALGHEGLTTLRSRRGGPPSAYGAASLCEVLRTGIDPMHVMVPNVMPRYRISEAECADLWAYLASR